MARRVRPLARSEHRADVVRAPRGDVEERLVAGDLIVCDRGFEHVPDAILLVLVFHVGPTHLRLALGHGIERIEVAVLPLGGGHDRDELVEVQPHHGVRLDLERIGGAFHDLVGIGIVEEDPLVLALPDPGGLLEVPDPPGVFAFLEAVWNRNQPAGRQPIRPEAVFDVNLIEGHWGNVIVPFQRGVLILSRAKARAQTAQEDHHEWGGGNLSVAISHGLLHFQKSSSSCFGGP